MEEKVRLVVMSAAVWLQENETSTTTVMFVVVLIAFAIGAVLAAIRGRNPARLFAKGEKEETTGHKLAARKSFKRAAELLEASKTTADKHPGLLGKAYLRLGLLEQGDGNRQEAFSFYKKARSSGMDLPPASFLLLAECHAQAGDTTEEALQAYLKYIASGPPSGDAARSVFAVLQNMGRVVEEMKSGPRKAAAEVDRRVIAANPNFEWAHYYLGLAQLLEGRTAEAKESFRTAQKLNPQRALTFYWLGICLLQQAEPDLPGAIETIEAFLKFPASDARHRKREAKACFEISKRLVQKVGGFETNEDCSKGDRQQTLALAVHYLGEAITRQPEDAASHFALGRAYGLQKNTAGMLAEIERAVELAPQEKQYIFQLGVERNRTGDLPGAVAALKKAVDVAPELGETHAVLGDILIQLSDYAAAEFHLRAALRQRDRDVASRAKLLVALYGQSKHELVIKELEALPPNTIAPRSHPEAAFPVGRCYLLIGKYAKAIEWLQGLRNSPEAIYYLGCALAHAGKLAEARSCFDSMVAGSSAFVSAALLQRGHLCWAEGDATRSATEYNEILRREPNHAGAHYGLGLLALAQANLGNAITHLSRAVELQPKNTAARFALGVAQERHGQVDEALANFRSVPAGVPERRPAALRSGVLLCRAGDFAAALGCFEELAAQGEESDALLFYRASSLAMSSKLEAAIRDWSKLAERYPGNERLGLNLARAYYQLGSQHLSAERTPQALAAWQKYLELYPSDDKTARQLGELHFRLAAASLEDPQSNLKVTLEHLREGVRADQTNASYAFYAALCELRLGKPERCLEALDSLRNNNDFKTRVLYHTALSLLQSGDTEEALEILNKVRSKSSGAYSVYAGWALANEKLRQGQMEEALEILDSESAELLPSH